MKPKEFEEDNIKALEVQKQCSPIFACLSCHVLLRYAFLLKTFKLPFMAYLQFCFQEIKLLCSVLMHSLFLLKGIFQHHFINI